MAMTRIERAVQSRGKASSRLSKVMGAWVLLWLGTMTGCGPTEEPTGAPELGTTKQELFSLNGLAFNGLAFNGLAFNGLAFNGLAFNGLAFNGLSTQAFSDWFKLDPPTADMVMRYTVACAAPYGQVRTYKLNGTTYTWYGWFGLAPDWANGSPATTAEQQIISACLAAHGNKYGKHVLISVQGLSARGQPIPTSSWELDAFPEREACFFGNLFTSEGLFVGNDRGMLDQRESTARACALSTSAEAARGACPPLVYADSCQSNCKKDPTNTYYVSCSYNGTTYLPITTRMRSEDIYRCGDGTCQFTESCGTGQQYNNCKSDCGYCSGFAGLQ